MCAQATARTASRLVLVWAADTDVLMEVGYTVARLALADCPFPQRSAIGVNPLVEE
jgi:hypothetical protein